MDAKILSEKLLRNGIFMELQIIKISIINREKFPYNG